MFYRTDDPVADAARYFQEQERAEKEYLETLPKCAHCKEPIQDRRYLEIEGEPIHRDCLLEFCEEHFEKENWNVEW